MSFAVIGAGRLGSSLALALCAQGACLTGYTAGTAAGRSRAEAWLGGRASAGAAELVAHKPSLYVIAVPDDVLPGVAEDLAGMMESVTAPPSAAPLVLHTSGATSVSALTACREAGALTIAFHPLQTFPDPIAGCSRFAGAAIAVTPAQGGADDEAALGGFALAHLLGAHPFLLPDEKRALYHAAAVMACNYFVALEHKAERLFEMAGLGGASDVKRGAATWVQSAPAAPEPGAPAQGALSLFLPLVAATLDNLREHGPERALTGPLSRGDGATVRRHLEALAVDSPDLLPLYRVLGLATLDLVRARGEVEPAVIDDLTRLLQVEAARLSAR